MSSEFTIEIFGKTQCPYCDMAKQLCETKGYEYTYKQLDTAFTKRELFQSFPSARTFPQIRIDGEAIGGYDNFKDWSSVA